MDSGCAPDLVSHHSRRPPPHSRPTPTLLTADRTPSAPAARAGFQTEQNFLTYYEMKYLLRKSCALQSYIRLLDAPAIFSSEEHASW